MTNPNAAIKYTAVLTAAATLAGAAYSFWAGGGQHGLPVLLAAGVAGVVGTGSLVKLVRATRRRELGRGWWLNIPAAAVAGLVLGMVVAPVATGDIEAAVFTALLIGWIPVVMLLWIGLTTATMVTRRNLRLRRSMG
jgi:hypothetical protein